MKNELRPAVFLDRDGTIIEDVPYLRDPARVRLLPGAARAIRQLRAAGFAVVVVTNQSGVARGMLTEGELAVIHDRVRWLLREQGAEIDGLYYCPHHPEAKVEVYCRTCGNRKPEAGMLMQAAADLGLDLSASWMIGDMQRDVEAGRRAGCRTVRLDPGGGVEPQGEPCCTPDMVAANLLEACERILGELRPNERERVTSHGG